MSKEHKHKFKYTEIKVPLLRQGDYRVGFDILKQWKCKCGLTQTFDIKERQIR